MFPESELAQDIAKLLPVTTVASDKVKIGWAQNSLLISGVYSNTFTPSSPVPPMPPGKEAPSGQTQTLHRPIYTQAWGVGPWLSKTPVSGITLHPIILCSLLLVCICV